MSVQGRERLVAPPGWSRGTPQCRMTASRPLTASLLGAFADAASTCRPEPAQTCRWPDIQALHCSFPEADIGHIVQHFCLPNFFQAGRSRLSLGNV
jgi:hypothetical protein